MSCGQFPGSSSITSFLPIPRPLLQSTLLSVPPEMLKSTQISVLFSILALSCQFTPNPPQEWPSGAVFYSASRAALGEDVWTSPDIYTAASLGLQSIWLERAGTQSSPEAAWGRRGEALRVAQAVRTRSVSGLPCTKADRQLGLRKSSKITCTQFCFANIRNTDRDPGHWDLDEEEIQKVPLPLPSL
jgi:hypothetical protein